MGVWKDSSLEQYTRHHNIMPPNAEAVVCNNLKIIALLPG